MTSQTGEQTVTIHILPDISELSDNKIWPVNRV